MESARSRSRIVPVALGLAMLSVVIAAALSPNVGVVQAQANSEYVTPSAVNYTYDYLAIAALVIVAGLILGLFLLRRRRRPPTAAPPAAAGAPPPMQAWQEGPPPPAGGAAPAAAPAYLETPEEVAHPPPAAPPPAVGAAAPPPTPPPPPAGEAEPDIDSLMAELDKISSDILKRPPKKGAGGGTETQASGDQSQ